MKPAPWEQYAVGDLADWQDWTPECKPFDSISHVTHISDALRIFEDREIRPSPTGESVLPTRNNVAWLSTNTWNQGSNYGNISFEFDWEKIIKDKHIYWVGDVPGNHFPTVRFLITDNKPPTRLLKYDPKIRNGPVYYDKKRSKWFWNGVTHFMFDTALPLSECATVTFVDHKKNSCKKSGCEEKGMKAAQGGARLLAVLIGKNLIQPRDKTIVNLFLNSEQKEKRLHDHAALAWDCILKSLSKGEGGSIASAHPAAPALAKAILDRFGSGRRTTDLANLFRNRKELKCSLIERGLKAFGVRSASSLSYLEDEED